MKVKKYTANTMPEVMKHVRKELGESAVILNSKEARTKGVLGFFRKKQIEVLAAVDPQPVPKRKKSQQTKVKSFETNHSAPKTKDKEFAQQLTANKNLLDEIKSLKQEINQRPYSSSGVPSDLQLAVEICEKQGINSDIQDELIDYLLEKYYAANKNLTDEDIRSHVHTFIKNFITPGVPKDLNLEAKHIYLFGPTGVGKTTTVAKLAADAAINKGKSVAFITMDTYRIAAIEQLKTYAKILNIPVEVAYNTEDFHAAKEKFKDKDHVFIDSAGRNFRKPEYTEQIKSFVNFETNDELYCVLALTAKEKDQDDIYQKFSELPVKKVIFTKADETIQYGSILNLWKKHKFEISFITFGQDVPEDIQDADAESITKMIVGEQLW